MFTPDRYELLGSLFLGKTERGPLLYDSRDLTTHAAILGMTGSGKTGLGIALLEECAIDGIPALIIDPKGDLANLALTFPGLSAAEFAPWSETPQDMADQWRTGLAGWGQGPERIAKLREAAEVAVFTPGSTAGRPLSVLASLAPPPTADAEVLAARVAAVVGGLLGLVGIDADPLASREHLLLSAIIATAWQARESLDLASLISRVQDPGFAKLGVMDLATVFPPKDRLALAMRLNQLAAAPAFAGWMTGEPLDIAGLLYTTAGRPRLAVISIAHLDDAQRQFVVGLILSELLGWMRSQAGSTSLRAVLYMDEIAGYVPPVANPPTKAALMTLLKQARAFGVGVVLASQNPADLDYKALSNIGTWWIGRLQTERDRAKVMQAFAGDAQAERVAALLPTLGARRFLQRNVHDDAPVVFETRWTMSYLRGPLTREDLRRLAQASTLKPVASNEVTTGAAATRRPVVPADVPQWFVPVRGTTAPTYAAEALVSALITFTDAKRGIRHERAVVLAASLSDGPVAVDWLTARELELPEAELAKRPEPGAHWREPAFIPVAKQLVAWGKSAADALYRRQSCTVQVSATGACSRPDEPEPAFRIRLADEGRVARDAAVADLRARFAPKLATLEERLRRARAAEDKERQQAESATWDSALAIGSSLLGAFFGRKTLSAANAGRLASGGRAVGRTVRERADVERAHDTVAAVESQLATLSHDFENELSTLTARLDPRSETFTTVTLVPKKTDIAIRLVGLVWIPQALGA